MSHCSTADNHRDPRAGGEDEPGRRVHNGGMHRAATAFVLAWLAQAGPAATIALAQVADVPPAEWSLAQVCARLDGNDPAEAAWAAHVAGEKKMTGAIASLKAALPRLVSPTADSLRARWHVLDALLLLDAELTADELLPHATGALRVPALLLAAKRPAANRKYFEARMAALDGHEDLEWRVCGNQLAALHEPTLAKRCLQRLQFELQLTVIDERSKPMHGDGLPLPRAPEPENPAFPPASYHELEQDNARCRTFAGCQAIAWRRVPPPSRAVPELPRCDPARAFADWLMAAGGEMTAAACAETSSQLEYRWRGVARLRQDVRAIQQQQQRAFAAMLRELVTSGELPAEDAARCRHTLQLTLFDQRGDRPRPLPTPAELLLPERGN